MFTGLVEKTGTLRSLDCHANGAVMEIGHTAWEQSLQLGESVCVSGACLTVARVASESFFCDVLEETLIVTRFSERKPGALLNLERALRVGDRMGGHFVTGHVDGTGIVRSLDRQARDMVLRVAVEPALASGILGRGSIAVEGISLTVSAVQDLEFEVHVIPTTWDVTNLCSLARGDRVNVETDMIGKYVRRYAEQADGDSLTMDKLIAAGLV